MIGTRLSISNADHPQTDSQIERVNRFIGDILCSGCANTTRPWISMLQVVEFAMSNSVHAFTDYTPFFVNGLTHRCVPLPISIRGSGLGGGGIAYLLAYNRPGTI